MNFGEIRRQIGNELQHNPDDEVHRADLRDVVNRVYRDLVTMHPWTFRWMKARFATYPDLRVANADWELPDSRTISTAFPAATFDLGVERLLYGLMGNYAVYVGPWNYAAQRFMIERAEYVSGQTINMTVDPRWTAGGKTAEGAWTIRFERFPLPADCMGVLGVAQIDATTGEVRPLGAWSPTDNQGLIRVNPDDTGPSRMWLMDIPGFSGPTNQTLTLPNLGQGTPYYGGGEPDLPRAPEKPPTLVQASALTGFLRAIEYEVGYTWAYGNRESGMSPTTKITLATTAHMGIEINALEVLPDALYGRSRCIYVRESDLGRWRRVQEMTDPTVANASVYLGTSSFNPLLNDIRWEDEPCNEWIRLYPRPQDYMEHELTYLRRPRTLQKDEDVPEFPPEFHHIIVHAALLDLQSRHSGFKCAAVHQDTYNAVLGRMRSRYLESAQLQILTKGSVLTPGRNAFSILVPPYTVPNIEG